MCNPCRNAETHTQFGKMSLKNVLSWNAKIADCIKQGHADEALKLFWHMEHRGVKPNVPIFMSVLQACTIKANLEMGKQIHTNIAQSGIRPNRFVDSTIVNMYMKCGSVEDAWHVFDKMPNRDAVSYNAMITGYAQHGLAEKAFHLYQQMCPSNGERNVVTYVSILNVCAKLKNLEWGKQIHVDFIKSGMKSNIYTCNTLIDMYNKCGRLEDAHQVFNTMPEWDVVSWNVMIAGYANNAPAKAAFELLQKMECEGVQPNDITFVSILNACTRFGNLEQGRQIHAHIEKDGTQHNSFVNNTLIDMYAKCGSIEDAQLLFQKIPRRDVVSWNMMIAGHIKYGHTAEALKLYEKMEQEGVKPNQVTFLSICHIYSSPAMLERAKQHHALIVQTPAHNDVSMDNALIDMYSKCGSLEDARQVFENSTPDVISWTTIIAGYAQHGQEEDAFNLFSRMQWEGVTPNDVTFLTLLNTSASFGNMEKAKQIHCHMINLGMKPDLSILNTVLSMYAKCENLKGARKMFDEMHERDVVSWNAMITGYAKYGHAEEALILFFQMVEEGVMADEVTFVSILNACASLAALKNGKQIHAAVLKTELGSSPFVGSALINMYAKCGSLDFANQILDRMPQRDVASWTAMIAGYAHHGHGKKALQLAKQMQSEGVRFNHITFISILSACSHAGLVNEGCIFFNSMCQVHGIEPTAKHYACMVDLLGRAGQLDEADEFIRKMPVQPTAALWMALLGACRVFGNERLAKRAAQNILLLEPQNTAAFMLLSSISASAGKWEDRAALVKMMNDGGVRKDPG